MFCFRSGFNTASSISPDGCGHFIGDVKKGQEFLNSLLLFAR